MSNSKRFTEAEKIYIKAFRLARRSGDKDLILDAGFKLERFQSTKLGKNKEAEKVVDFINSYCTKIDDTDCIVKSVIRHGEFLQKKNKFIEALVQFNRAMQLVENTDDKNLYWKALTSRGSLFRVIGDYDQSKKDYKKAVHYLREEDSEYTKGISYVNISASFGNDQPDSTIYYSKLA